MRSDRSPARGAMKPRLRRRSLIGALCALGLVPALARAQPKVPRIGLLDPGLAHLFAAFIEAMAALGYIEGRSVAYVRRSTEGRAERFATLAAELVQLKVDLIVTT